jgi:hypothetical protein
LQTQLLGELVKKSGYSPQAAAELHKQLYRQKMMGLVAKKKLSEEEQADLKRVRRILCIPQEVANQVRPSNADADEITLTAHKTRRGMLRGYWTGSFLLPPPLSCLVTPPWFGEH